VIRRDYSADVTPGALPRAATLACWLNACIAGQVSPDDFSEQVRGDDPHHLVAGLPGSEPVPLLEAVGRLRQLGGVGASLALPAPGDPVGLAGPARFNAAALDQGSAVIVTGASLGLVPTIDARTVVWVAQPAQTPVALDPGEASGILRRTLLEVTQRLVALDVAGWQPEIPDLLINLRHRGSLPLPPGYDARRVEMIERGVLCLDIVGLARASDGGAVSAYEMDRRTSALSDLDRSARRALVAGCGR
jgi:hypothetical protein